MSREEVRTMLSMISGNTTEKIQFGFPMKTWSPSENEDVDGRLIHAWILEHLNEGESFKSHDGSLSLERFKHDVVGHFDCGKGIWVFTFGRIQYYRKPRAFARVGWKDLTRDKIGNNLTRGLPEYEGLDYLAVFPTIDCSNPQWVLVEGPINTIGLPTHQPVDRETKFVMLDGKFNIPTAPLAAGMDHDLIGISTFESAIQHGIQNYTDSLGPRIRLRTSYFQSTLNPDRVIKLDWSNLIVCEKTVEGNSRELILNNSFQTTIDGEVVRGTHFGCVNIEFGSIRIDGSGFKKNGEDYEFVGYDLDFERVG